MHESFQASLSKNLYCARLVARTLKNSEWEKPEVLRMIMSIHQLALQLRHVSSLATVYLFQQLQLQISDFKMLQSFH